MRSNQNEYRLGKRTGATVAEAIEERVRPTTLAVSVQRQVLGVGVRGHLHSRVPLREPLATQRCSELKGQTVG